MLIPEIYLKVLIPPTRVSQTYGAVVTVTVIVSALSVSGSSVRTEVFVPAGGEASSVEFQYPSRYAAYLRETFPSANVTVENGDSGRGSRWPALLFLLALLASAAFVLWWSLIR